MPCLGPPCTGSTRVGSTTIAISCWWWDFGASATTSFVSRIPFPSFPSCAGWRGWSLADACCGLWNSGVPSYWPRTRVQTPVVVPMGSLPRHHRDRNHHCKSPFQSTALSIDNSLATPMGEAWLDETIQTNSQQTIISQKTKSHRRISPRIAGEHKESQRTMKQPHPHVEAARTTEHSTTKMPCTPSLQAGVLEETPSRQGGGAPTPNITLPCCRFVSEGAGIARTTFPRTTNTSSVDLYYFARNLIK